MDCGKGKEFAVCNDGVTKFSPSPLTDKKYSYHQTKWSARFCSHMAACEGERRKKVKCFLVFSLTPSHQKQPNRMKRGHMEKNSDGTSFLSVLSPPSINRRFLNVNRLALSAMLAMPCWVWTSHVFVYQLLTPAVTKVVTKVFVANKSGNFSFEPDYTCHYL